MVGGKGRGGSTGVAVSSSISGGASTGRGSGTWMVACTVWLVVQQKKGGRVGIVELVKLSDLE